jgi:hypothetical protein
VRFSPGSFALALLTTVVVEPGWPLQEGGFPVVQKKKPRLRRGGVVRLTSKGVSCWPCSPQKWLSLGGRSRKEASPVALTALPTEVAGQVILAPEGVSHLRSYAADRVHRPRGGGPP